MLYLNRMICKMLKYPKAVVFSLVMLLFVEAWSFHYCLLNIFNKNIHFLADMVIGFFIGEFTLPLAIVIWILKIFGLDFIQ